MSDLKDPSEPPKPERERDWPPPPENSQVKPEYNEAAKKPEKKHLTPEHELTLDPPGYPKQQSKEASYAESGITPPKSIPQTSQEEFNIKSKEQKKKLPGQEGLTPQKTPDLDTQEGRKIAEQQAQGKKKKEAEFQAQQSRDEVAKKNKIEEKRRAQTDKLRDKFKDRQYSQAREIRKGRTGR